MRGPGHRHDASLLQATGEGIASQRLEARGGEVHDGHGAAVPSHFHPHTLALRLYQLCRTEGGRGQNAAPK